MCPPTPPRAQIAAAVLDAELYRAPTPRAPEVTAVLDAEPY